MLDIKKHIIEIVLLAYLLVFGALLLYVKADYWSFVDWISYPTLNSDFISNSINHVYGILLIIFVQIIDSLKAPVLDFSMTVFGYDLLIPVFILYAIFSVLAIANYFRNVKSVFAMLLLFLVSATLLTYAVIGDGVTKDDVNKRFMKWSSADVTGDNYVKEIMAGHYHVVDADLESIQKRYMSGSITGADYQFEYDKFKSAVTPTQLEKISDWVAHAKHRAFALSARGLMFENLGWDARGSKYASETSAAQLAAMRHYFTLAIADHKEAIQLDKHVLISYTSLYRMASAGDFGYDRHDISKQAMLVFPGSYVLAYDVIEKLEPKWGGSEKEMRDFAKSERQRAHLNPELIALSSYQSGIDCKNNLYYKRYYQAIYYCRRALLYAPRWTVSSDLYDAYFAKNDYKNALNTINEYLLHRKATAKPLLDRAIAYIKLGDTQHAVVDASNAVGKPMEAWQYDRAGWVFEYAHDYKPAIDAYMSALDSSPTDDYALQRLFYASSRMPSLDSRVVKYFNVATQLRPDNAQYWLFYARDIEHTDAKAAAFAYTRYLALISASGLKDRDTEEAIEYAKQFTKK